MKRKQKSKKEKRAGRLANFLDFLVEGVLSLLDAIF